MAILSNIVDQKKFREVQLGTMNILVKTIMNSFGPNASNTKIVMTNGDGGHVVTFYTKDGHTILKNVHFQDLIEESTRHDLEELTLHIVKEVGDGTTSAIILAKLIFEKLIDLESSMTPYEIIAKFKEAVAKVKELILKEKQEFNSDRAYDIALISTNGNEEVAENIKNIYDKFGNDVFIDVAASINEQSMLKEYDGMTISSGYSDVAYINDEKKGTCSLRNPRIYVFEDPIDTQEMMNLFVAIIEGNITQPINDPKHKAEIIPTVILAPKISRDMGTYMRQIISYMYSIKDVSRKPPLLVIGDVYQTEQLGDISRLCGCKPIRKYINPDKQNEDIKKGDAPTLETVVNFYGQADMIESDLSKTKFINPKLMKDKDGNLSETFTSQVAFLEAELKRAYEEQMDVNVTGNLKRRINSLKANMVEYLVGGISVMDRDSLKDLVEDAVLNCRSAARNGVGYGANFEGLKATLKLKNEGDIFEILNNCYQELVKALYSTSYKHNIEGAIKDSLDKGQPLNLKTKKFDGKVLSSIDSDIVVLDTISKIVTIMFTSNQFLCPTVMHNKYSVVE